MESAQLRSAVADLLSGAGIPAGEVDIQAVDGGGNNRVFSVHTPEVTYLAKFYYSHPDDTRNRLGAEYSFLAYARKIGLDCVPRPIYCSPEKNMGLYEFVEGRKLSSAELTGKHVMQAACFIRELNARPDRDRTLQTASEGCFSIEQHLALIDKRLQRLHDMPVDSDVDRQARAFVDMLEHVWVTHKKNIAAQVVSLPSELDIGDRCISPSDFGFHNALLRNNGDICFIDFEYAGWDDPAKMIGDFFSQPAVPISSDYFDDFLMESLSYSQHKEMLAVRARLLLPVFQVKWCCIMLNEFLPDAAKRRRFANPTLEPELRKGLQLEKAQQFFKTRLEKTWLT
ncbi:MAG: phosphotransferase [Sideroxydans sp.]|nr:phosphotransferase [Sideroxydans sp.]